MTAGFWTERHDFRYAMKSVPTNVTRRNVATHRLDENLLIARRRDSDCQEEKANSNAGSVRIVVRTRSRSCEIGWSFSWMMDLRPARRYPPTLKRSAPITRHALWSPFRAGT